MSQGPGLRERKKQQTRQHLADTARRLFAERTFESVTVADVANAAGVSEATVFNYFRTKEDLFYVGLEAFENQLLSSMRDRPAGESILDAFRRFVLQPRGLLASTDPASEQRLVATTRVIAESPALLAREQQIFVGYTASLAALIAEDTGADPAGIEPWVTANALMGVHRGLVDYSRRQILAGVRNPELSAAVHAQGEQALAALAHGLADYAVRQ